MTMQLRDGYRQLAPDGSEDHLEQAREVLERSIDILGMAMEREREAGRQLRRLRERQVEANIALTIGAVGCGTLLACLFLGGWWAAGLQMGLVGWLMVDKARRA